MVKCLKVDIHDSQTDITEHYIFKQRQSLVGLELVGKRCFIHNGLKLVPMRVVDRMVGYRFGSFIPFRPKFRKQIRVIKEKSNNNF